MKKFFLFSFAFLFTGGIVVLAQVPQPGAPATCNGGNCTQPTSETCPPGGSTIVTNFTGATLRSGSPTSLPALYTFYNIATVSGQQINATVTIEAQSNCAMNGGNFSIDDDGATDQNGNSIASFFAPRITPDQNLTGTDRRGYVQFVIRFYVENGTAGEQYPADYTNAPAGGGLTGLNYIHYDIDGSTVGSGGWFRETGVIESVAGSVVNGDVSTELISYTYTDAGFNWKGFAGSVCERTGVSRCAQVAAAASYSTPQSILRFRMGYDYNNNGTNFNQQPTRQFGSRFGCFSFPQQTPLPVKLLSFTGTYKNGASILNWVAENQVNFSAYEVERSIDGNKFQSVGVVNRQGTGLDKQQYQYAENLTSIPADAFYYRLKMVDIDGKYSYSNVILLRKDGIRAGGLSVSPNPVVSGNLATARFESARKTIVDIAILDMNGRVLLRQQNQVMEGVNSISINNLNRLQPGLYTLRINDGQDVQSVKLSVAR